MVDPLLCNSSSGERLVLENDHTLLSANYHLKKSKFLNILLVAIIAAPPALAQAKEFQSDTSAALACDADFNQAVLTKVDKQVRNELYSKELSEKVWPKALESHKKRILEAKNLLELSAAINAAISELKSSHCQFLTINDDTFYFLYSLFPSDRLHQKTEGKGISVFPGFVTGGVGFQPDRVRYVLEDSPADKAHIQVADQIVSVNGHKFVGQSNFFNLENGIVSIDLMRKSQKHTVQLSLIKKPMYDWYSSAVEKSARKFEQDGLKLGYVHLWCGGKAAQEAMQDSLDAAPLRDCDGLILDLRDGYGACSPDALDPFFRQPAAYPDFETISRKGRRSRSSIVYTKPMVAIINGGSRSGKEQLAFSLKNTKRALVVGDRTAGYFLAGTIIPINEKCFLYLAVFDCSLSGVRLEGKGVETDLSVQNDKKTSEDKQLDAAKSELVKRIREAKNSENKSEKNAS